MHLSQKNSRSKNLRHLKWLLKPLQSKKGQKVWGTREKSSLFPYKRTAFFSGTPNFFGPSYFEAALVHSIYFWLVNSYKMLLSVVQYRSSLYYLYFRSLLLLLGAKKYGIRTSPSQFSFYFLWLFTGAINLRSIILRRDDRDNFDPDASDRLLIFYATQLGLHVL